MAIGPPSFLSRSITIKEAIHVFQNMPTPVTPEDYLAGFAGETLLTHMEKQDLRWVKYAIAVMGANVNYQNKSGLTPLLEATRKGWIAGINHLLTQTRIDINLRTAQNLTPLTVLVGHCHSEQSLNQYNSFVTLFGVFLFRGANPNIVSHCTIDPFDNPEESLKRCEGYGPVFVAYNTNYAVLAYLLNNPRTHPDIQDQYGYTPLIKAVLSLRHQCISPAPSEVLASLLKRFALLARHSDLSTKDHRGFTVIDYVKQFHLKDLFRILAQTLPKNSPLLLQEPVTRTPRVSAEGKEAPAAAALPPGAEPKLAGSVTHSSFNRRPKALFRET